MSSKETRGDKRSGRGYGHEEFLERLKEVAVFLRDRGEKGDIVWTKFARTIGFEYDLLMSWINKGNTPLVDGLISFCNKTGISMDWLLMGAGPMLSPHTTGRHFEDTRIYVKKIHAIEGEEDGAVTKEDVDFLITVLEQHAFDNVRCASARALQRHPSRRAESILMHAAREDKDVSVRMAAQDALTALDRGKYGPWVMDMLDEKDKVIPPPPRLIFLDAGNRDILQEVQRYHDRDAFVPIRVLRDIGSLRFAVGRAETDRYAMVFHKYLPPAARHQSLENEQFVCVIADDDSMGPTIPRGAVALVDRFDTEIEDRKIYAVFTRREKDAGINYPEEDVITLKRVHRASDYLILSADNPADKRYPRATRSENEKSLIRGRVLWWESTQ